jgi:predicted DNA-binding transcriptional regulator AlpA
MDIGNRLKLPKQKELTMPETMDRFLSIREVTVILGLGRTTLYRMALSGELCPRKIRRRVGYLETEVQLYMKSLPVAVAKQYGALPVSGELPIKGRIH